MSKNSQIHPSFPLVVNKLNKAIKKEKVSLKKNYIKLSTKGIIQINRKIRNQKIYQASKLKVKKCFMIKQMILLIKIHKKIIKNILGSI